MADAPLSRLLSSAHTWLLWDEVTTPVLARTLQTLWKQCCVASHCQSRLWSETRVPKQEWTFRDPQSWLLGLVWRTTYCRSLSPLQLYIVFFVSQFHLSPCLCSASPLSCYSLHPSPSHPLSPSPLFPFLFVWLFLDRFIWSGAAEPVGKAPGYICQLLKLDLLHAGWLWGIFCWVYLRNTCTPPAASAPALLWLRN